MKRYNIPTYNMITHHVTSHNLMLYDTTSYNIGPLARLFRGGPKRNSRPRENMVGVNMVPAEFLMF